MSDAGCLFYIVRQNLHCGLHIFYKPAAYFLHAVKLPPFPFLCMVTLLGKLWPIKPDVEVKEGVWGTLAINHY